MVGMVGTANVHILWVSNSKKLLQIVLGKANNAPTSAVLSIFSKHKMVFPACCLRAVRCLYAACVRVACCLQHVTALAACR